MSLNKNQIISLNIDSLSSDGNGVGRYEGMPVFVPFSAPGDTLQVKIVKPCKSYAFGIIESILSPSGDRIAADCPIFGRCGGCALRHISYAAELAAKQNFVADAMRRLGGLQIETLPTLPSLQENRYRNKVQFPITTAADGSVQAGFYAGRSHRVIPCADCLLQPKLLNKIAQDICEILTSLSISAYDEIAHRGLVRHLYLRHAVSTNTVMVCLVINGTTLPKQEEFLKLLLAKHPEIDTVVLNINRARTNVITGTENRTLYGTGLLKDTLCGVPVELNPLSFYQVNTAGAEQLYQKAAELAALQPHETLLDLYCGTGTIGLSMAHRCKKLIGVEIVPEAIENAKRNAAAMQINHAEFMCADAGKAAQTLAAAGLTPDVIVLDPPRKGCDENALDAVLAMCPKRIVMISCNPATAARDVRYLQDRGYHAHAAQPVDLFPRTKHVETCVLLSHKNS